MTAAASSSASAPDPDRVHAPRKPAFRRRWLWRLGSLVLLAYLAPYVVAHTALRHWLLRQALRPMNARPNVSELSLGWFSPVRAKGITVRPPEFPPVFEVDALQTTQPLWQLLFARGSDVQVSLQRPKFRLAMTEQGTNVHALLPSAAERTRKPLGRRVQIDVVDGSFVWSASLNDREWQTGPFNLQAALVPASEQQPGPAVVVAPGKLLDNVELSQGMCHDVLKYVHPLFADAAQVSGRISLSLSQCRLPLAENGPQPEGTAASSLATATIEGALDLHRVSLGPGPLIAELADLLGVPAEVELVHESHVSFSLREGRVHPEHLEFLLARMQVVTSGSVGLDQTLDLVAEFRLAPGVTPEPDQPLLQALAHHTLRLPIRGTLSRPRIDMRSLGRGSLGVLADVIESLAQQRRQRAQPPAEAEDRRPPPHVELPRIRRLIDRLWQQRAEP